MLWNYKQNLTILIIQEKLQTNNIYIKIKQERKGFKIAEMNQDEQGDYRQQLGLKKILYKYENENQQLRSQIMALNERLQSILNKPKTPLKKQNLNPIQQYQGQLLKEQMHKLFKQINVQSQQMKINKDGIDQRHQQKCIQLQNKIVKEQKQIKQLKFKLEKYQKIDQGMKVNQMLRGNDSLLQGQIHKNGPQKYLASQLKIDTTALLMSNNRTLRNSTMRVQNYLQKLNNIKQQAQNVRKSIKQLQKERNQNDRNLVKKHVHQNDVKVNNRILEFGKAQQSTIEESPSVKKPGIWGMDNTKENYQFIRGELQNLKRQKDTVLGGIKNQNIVLENKIKQLQLQLDGVNRSVQIPALPYQKRPLKVPVDLSYSTKLQSPLLMKKSLKPLDLGPAEYQRNNDKNFIPKKMRKVEWQSAKNKSGIEWHDSQLKSPIIGVNMWFDGYLIGIQFIHQLANSSQHLQIMGGKKIIPIQYRVGSNDFVENVLIYITDGLIYGMEYVTKNGRTDKFGNVSKAKKYDFGIKKPEKPVISFGQYRVNNNVSQITKLGFQVI